MLAIPKSTLYMLKEGASGIPAFTVQRLANKLGIPTAEDLSWGPKTTESAKKVQTRLAVTADGVFGPATQRALTEYLCDRESQSLPAKLLISKITYESMGYLTAVNWSVAGGVDCGITQRRVYEEQYLDDAAVKRAFDAVYQVGLSADRVLELYGIFLPRAGVKGNKELAWRLAVLNHNYPSAADTISRNGINGLSSYWRTTQNWVTVHGLKFPDGAPIRTPLEWSQRYALGNQNHNEPGQAVRLVRSWS